MALFMHMSILCGVPIFLLGIFSRRDDPFILHHAKAAGVGYLLFYATLLLGLFLWTPLFWASLLFYVPSLAGVWRGVRGERVGWLGLGHLGEALFFPIQPRPLPGRRLLHDPPSSSARLPSTDGDPHHPRP